MRVSLQHARCDDDRCRLFERRKCIPTELRRERDDDRFDVMLIGEAPSAADIARTRPLMDEAGCLLRKALRKAKPKTELNVAFSTVVRCCPNEEGDSQRPGASEIRHCRNLVERDIERFDPDVLVLLGTTAAKTFVPNVSTIQQERGHWQRLMIAGRERIGFVTYAPGYVLRQLSNLPVFYGDIRFAMRLAAGWRPRPEWSRLGTATCLQTVEEVRQLVERLLTSTTGDVALDVETRNLNKRYGNRLGMVQFCADGDTAYCVPLDHPQTPFDPSELQQVRELLRRVFTEPVSFRWITHFGKFEQIQIGQHILDRGDGVARTFHNAPMLDTGAFAYVLNENVCTVKGAYQLKSLARRYLGFHHYDDATLMARADGDLMRLPLFCSDPIGHPRWRPNLTDYGAMDVQVTWRLFRALQEEAATQRYRRKAIKLLQELFGPTFRLMSVIERNGFWGNLSHLKMLQDRDRSPIISRLLEIDRTIVPAIKSAQRANETLVSRASGGNTPIFNMPWVLDLNKNAHVAEWLVNEVGLEPLSVGKSGAPSVGKEFFQAYGDIEEVALVEERRGLSKLHSAYVKQLIEYLDPRYCGDDTKDGRVRCDMFFTSTVSGRASAAKPNMQQQVRGDSPAKKAIKDIWQAEQPGVQDAFQIDFTRGPPDICAPHRKPTNCLVQLDYVTAEVKIWGVMSQCPDLLRSLRKGYEMRRQYRAAPTPELKDAAAFEGDLHRNTASLMFGVQVDQVDKNMRTASKGITFGSMYGRGVKALAAQIKKSEEEAQKLFDKFAGAFPIGWQWLQDCPKRALSDWYIETPMGRRRRLPGYLLHHPEWFEMTYDERRVVSGCDRMAKNSPIQAFSSDIGFLAASLFAHYIETHGKSWKIENVVHDSCVFETPIAELREAVEIAERCFTTDVMRVISDTWKVTWGCPLEIDFEFGLTWGSLKKWDFTDAEFDRLVSDMLATTTIR